MTQISAKNGFFGPEGARLYYEVAGEGEPLLLLHAGVADSRMWDEQFAIFAQYYQVIRYDLRGFGRSEVPAGPFSNVEDIAHLLDFLHVERASLIGASFGGKTALDFTLTYPDRVNALILVAPGVGGYPPSPAVQQFNADEEAALEGNDLTAATELNLRMWVDGPKRTPEQVAPQVRERVRIMQHHAFTVPIPETTEELDIAPPAITRLADIHVPTLIIVGDYDIPDMLVLAELLAKEIPDAKQIIIPGVAHMVSMEQPEAFN
ncbi:MAG TPA: alpha/beta hydrolase, partial [Ktedonobacteraceae bacterium]|nr:alpha/beta hydrolase [Ktedonobacteraceae bacterium]